LDEAQLGEPATVAGTDVDDRLRRRLAELGVRPGEQVVPLHRTSGGGRVLGVGATRLALSRSVLRRVRVETS
jgi:ferrous iron transport protein A